MSTKRNTLPILDKYTRASVLSARAAEIADGALITVKNPGTINPYEIAKLELAAGTSPKKVQRVWPSGEEEIFSLTELKSVDL